MTYDLFTFWGELVDRAVRTGGTYDQAAYLETAQDLGVPRGAAAAMARLADTDHGDTGALLADGLAAAGVEGSPDTVGDAAYREGWVTDPHGRLTDPLHRSWARRHTALRRALGCG